MNTFFITLAFAFMAISPRLVKAETAPTPTEITDVRECLRIIQTTWIPQSDISLSGKTRTETPCKLSMSVSTSRLAVQAEGAPLSVAFELKESAGAETTTLQACRVDKEKLHIVFEEKPTNDFEKRERVQMTLLKRQGSGLSLILSKRENKILRPLQQSSLICHLN